MLNKTLTIADSALDDKVESVQLINKQIHIVIRKKSNLVWGNGARAPDRIWKEIYGAKDGEIVYLKRIDAKHIPEKLVPEQIIFEE